MPDQPLPRVSPPRVYPAATRASRPPAAAGGSADTHRQTGFILGAELDFLIEALNREGVIAEASGGAKYRKQVVAVSLGLWSRSWLARIEALHAVEWGNYASAFPLIHAAADFEATSAAVAASGAGEWEQWLAEGGISAAPADHATAFRLVPAPGKPYVEPPAELAYLRRLADDLGSPQFASTLLLAGNESTPERVLMTFGDRDFHLGLAELALGCLVQLTVVRARTVLTQAGVLAVETADVLEATIRDGEAILARDDRCRALPVERDGVQRHLIRDWRRQEGGQPRRLLL